MTSNKDDLKRALLHSKSMVKVLHKALRDIDENRNALFEALVHWRSIKRQHEIALAQAEGRIARVARTSLPSLIEPELAGLTNKQLEELIAKLEEKLAE